jgi:U3 small nucleolar RNA-associated protein 6
MVKYGIKRKLYGMVKDSFMNHCTRNPLDVDLWIFCASKCFEMDDVESARTIFQRGIRMNQNDAKIWLEFFRMEILYIEKMLKINEEAGVSGMEKSVVEKGEVPFLIFKGLFDLKKDSEELKEMEKLSRSHPELNQRIGEVLNCKSP